MALKDLAEIDPKRVFRFMLSTTVDSNTLALRLIPNELGQTKNTDARTIENLNLAETNLKLAIEKDPFYTPAKINLSSVKILKKDYSAAEIILGDVFELTPLQPDALNNKAIALYLKEPGQNADLALSYLNAITKQPKGKVHRYAKYNVSRIRFEQLQCFQEKTVDSQNSCLSMAKKTWSPVLQTETNSVYARLVKTELGNKDKTAVRQTEKKTGCVGFGK